MDKQLIDAFDTDQRRMLENIRTAATRIWSRPLLAEKHIHSIPEHNFPTLW